MTRQMKLRAQFVEEPKATIVMLASFKLKTNKNSF
jgi:hypothetical protein